MVLRIFSYKEEDEEAEEDVAGGWRQFLREMLVAYTKHGMHENCI
jgi:hypothetical protein